MDTGRLTSELKHEARRLGFQLAGACPAVTPEGLSRFHQWLDAGYAGEMHYLDGRRDAYDHPRSILQGVRSILMLAMNYSIQTARPTRPGQGRISRYAWGPHDYHDVIHDRLKQLAAFVRDQLPSAQVRGVVDSAPLLEREFAQLAGLGWQGKNTLLLNKTVGSWFFLSALLLDIDLQYDPPNQTEHCGTCTACLDACPTGAFPAPYVLDATKCISYLTIELRGPIPIHLRPGLEDWLFGCDRCQEVCPWNRHAPGSSEVGFQVTPEFNPVDLCELFELTDEQFRQRFRRTPMWRSKRRGLLRNAAILLGNRPTPSAIGALRRGLGDSETLVRGASAWALGQYDDPLARTALHVQLSVEPDPEVRGEIESVLKTP